MTIFFLDNFDSFTYNLVYELERLGYDLKVYRNDTPEQEILNLMCACTSGALLCISPGPGNPEQSGRLLPLIACVRSKFPILGICLGLQALAQSYGARIERCPEIVHGKSTHINLEPFGAFEGLGRSLEVARYHSLMATQLPDELQVIAHYQNIVMGIYHPQDKILAYQFHPESIMTPKGAQLLKQSVEFLENALKPKP
ncbi:aminodeoxychorismate/anthranilate synthase component II [Helicobacter salomonis]|uniref:aminodeoxychorismate/anthranilate synthase component II n=1 Tax=Helicobacter salomonis TaxID=56878 RepID=UPI000CF0D655|nr:aminodeoxychorismate/anthranilate synthase component II [Helicobacter salomonis]